MSERKSAKKKRVTGPDSIEAMWLAMKLREKLDASGFSQAKYAKLIGVKNGETHLSYMFSGRRSLSFVKAVRIATAAGIDLSELQSILVIQGKSEVDL